MNFYLKEQNRDIFGRKVTFQEEFEFDEYYTMLYLFPLVSDQVPIFIPDTLGVENSNQTYTLTFLKNKSIKNKQCH